MSDPTSSGKLSGGSNTTPNPIPSTENKDNPPATSFTNKADNEADSNSAPFPQSQCGEGSTTPRRIVTRREGDLAPNLSRWSTVDPATREETTPRTRLRNVAGLEGAEINDDEVEGTRKWTMANRKGRLVPADAVTGEEISEEERSKMMALLESDPGDLDKQGKADWMKKKASEMLTAKKYGDKSVKDIWGDGREDGKEETRGGNTGASYTVHFEGTVVSGSVVQSDVLRGDLVTGILTMEGDAIKDVDVVVKSRKGVFKAGTGGDVFMSGTIKGKSVYRGPELSATGLYPGSMRPPPESSLGPRQGPHPDTPGPPPSSPPHGFDMTLPIRGRERSRPESGSHLFGPPAGWQDQARVALSGPPAQPRLADLGSSRSTYPPARWQDRARAAQGGPPLQPRLLDLSAYGLPQRPAGEGIGFALHPSGRVVEAGGPVAPGTTAPTTIQDFSSLFTALQKLDRPDLARDMEAMGDITMSGTTCSLTLGQRPLGHDTAVEFDPGASVGGRPGTPSVEMGDASSTSTRSVRDFNVTPRISSLPTGVTGPLLAGKTQAHRGTGHGFDPRAFGDYYDPRAMVPPAGTGEASSSKTVVDEASSGEEQQSGSGESVCGVGDAEEIKEMGDPGKK